MKFYADRVTWDSVVFPLLGLMLAFGGIRLNSISHLLPIVTVVVVIVYWCGAFSPPLSTSMTRPCLPGLEPTSASLGSLHHALPTLATFSMCPMIQPGSWTGVMVQPQVMDKYETKPPEP